MPKEVKISLEYKKNIFPYSEKLSDKDYLKLLVTDVGLYSTTKKYEGSCMIKCMVKQLKSMKLNPAELTITDGTAGNGSDVLLFSLYFKKVNAVELDPIHCKVVKNNVKVYKKASKVKIYCPADYVEKAFRLKQDVVFLDPPWGGPDYMKNKKIRLKLGDVDVVDLVKKIKVMSKAKCIFLKCPLNVDLHGLNFKSYYVKNRKGISKFKLVYF